MSRRRRLILAAAGLLFAACAGYLTLWPTGLDPEAWRPQPAPGLIGPYARNDALAGVELLGRELSGPEAVTVGPDGWLWTGTADGKVARIRRDGGEVEVVAETGGRPIGLRFDGAGRLWVCDADRGLLRVGRGGAVEVIATEADGVPFHFVDDLAIGRDGTVYFSDASSRRGIRQVKEEVLDHRPNGRLLALHPEDGRVEVLAGGLYFANGVALAPDESYVLVNETASYRITRVWLRGERRGQRDLFADNLPGFPDNITWSPSRRAFWVAIYAPRDAGLDAMAPRPFLRKVVARLPAALQPKPKRHAFALAFDEQGQVVANLQHAAPDAYAPVTSVLEADGWLYLGSLTHAGVARLKAP